MTNTQMLGPFLCRPTTTSMGFWFSAGTLEPQSIEIKIEGTEKSASLSRIESDDSYNCWMGTALELTENTSYKYSVKIDGTNYIPDGLTSTDLKFTTLTADRNAPFDFILMSCHGIEAYENEKKLESPPAWNMWNRLERELDRYPHCRVAILGGDQVYMDDTFGEDLRIYNKGEQAEMKEKIRAAYYRYWSNLSYRKVMARIPCFLMWDDHDIIDGWGSREEALRDNDKWTTYFGQLNSAFAQFQASRNPKATNINTSYSFISVIGEKAFVALDLRRNRKILDKRTSQMMSTEQKKDLEAELKKLPASIQQVFIISPVTVARMGGSVEEFLGNFSNFLWSLGSRISYGNPMARALLWGTISAVLYFGLRFNTPNFPATVQALILLVISIFLLCNRSNVIQYFTTRKLWLEISFVALTAISLLAAGLSFWMGARRTESNPFEVLGANIHRSIWPAFDDIKLGLILGSVAFLTFLIYTKIKAKVFKQILLAIVAITMLSLITFNIWLGLPGWKLHISNIWTWPTMVLLGVFTVGTFILGLLEAQGVIDKIAGLDDDIRDGWSSHANKAELTWLIERVAGLKTQGIQKIYLLCGDIHTGGLSTLKFYVKGTSANAYQITSSPISYITMPPLVEKLTSSNNTMKLEGYEGSAVKCTNLFYRSYRNFAVVRTRGTECSVDFHFEDLQNPVCIDI